MVYLGQSAITSLIPLLLLIVFTRYLSPEDYGAYALAQVFAIFVINFCNLGLPDVFERNYFLHNESRSDLSKLLFTFLIFSIVVFFPIALTLFYYESEVAVLLGFSGNKNLVFTVLISQFLSSQIFYFLTFFKNSGEAGHYAQSLILVAVLNAVCSLFLIVYVGTGVIGLAISQVIALTIVLSGLVVILLRRIGFSTEFSLLKSSLRMSIPLTPRAFTGVIATQFDKYMLGVLSTVSGVGLYSLAQRISSVSNLFMVALQNVFTPHMYKLMFDKGDTAQKEIGLYLTPFAFLSMIPSLFLVLLADEITYLFFPAEYGGLAPLIILLSIFYASLFFGKVLGKQLMYKGNTVVVTFLTFFSVGVNVALNFPLIIWFGAEGAAIASFVANIISTVVGLSIAQHYYHIKWETFKLAIIFGFFLLTAVSIYLMKIFAVGYELVIVAKFAALLMCAFLARFLGLLTKRNLLMVIGRY